MKKFIAIVLAVLTVFSFSTAAFAEGNTTTLTTTVPDATYTLNIPADQEIAFGTIDTDIGSMTVTNSSGFAEGKNLQVTLTFDSFKAEGLSTTIPFRIKPMTDNSYSDLCSTGEKLAFLGNVDGTVSEYPYDHIEKGKNGIEIKSLGIMIYSTDWGKALGGEYTSTITFTAEVVSVS